MFALLFTSFILYIIIRLLTTGYGIFINVCILHISLSGFNMYGIFPVLLFQFLVN